MKLDIIPIELIEEGDRFRKDYGEMGELISDINRRGLISPLAVREMPDGRYILLAGGRRLLAMKTAKQDRVPVRIYDEAMDEIEMRMVELSENIYRKDLEMKERLALTKEIHNLMQQKYGQRREYRMDLNPDAEPEGWGVRQTAELLGVSPGLVAQHLKVAEAMEAIPELFLECRTVKDASRVIDQMGEQIILAELAKRQDVDSSVRKLSDAYVVGDFFEMVKQIPDGYFDIVELDPPYGVEVQNNLVRKDGVAEFKDLTREEFHPFFQRIIRELPRIMAPNSWLICWYAPEPHQETTYNVLQMAGFRGLRIPGVWVKPSGFTAEPRFHLTVATEFFYYMRRGQPVVSKTKTTNTFLHTPVHAANRVHPIEKPIPLLKEILAAFGSVGQHVFVPFCGSGNTLIAAHELGMHPLGVELEASYKRGYLAKLMKGGLSNGGHYKGATEGVGPDLGSR